MKLIVNIDMDNAAFADCPATEAARILRRIAKKMEEGEDGGKVMDVNGNSVGNWEVGKE
jgi:hypothetical protein